MEETHHQNLDLTRFGCNQIHKIWLDLVSDPLGNPIALPVLIYRGSEEGPVLGLTAAVHGDELNGIPVIQRLFREITNEKIKGTVVGIPVTNIPSFHRRQRRFIDGVDLNHIMPGKAGGNVSQVYAYRLVEKVIRHFDFLIDLHTASFGRINSYYIRADLRNESARHLAHLQHAQIIVDNPPLDGTLRGAAASLDIPAITLEVGNPNTFQRGLIRSGITGLYNAMIYLGMIDDKIETPLEDAIVCQKSKWIYTEAGGLLSVVPELTQILKKGELIASQYNVFGDKITDYFAPEDGVVIGKSTHPVNQTGGRILHLGIFE